MLLGYLCGCFTKFGYGLLVYLTDGLLTSFGNLTSTYASKVFGKRRSASLYKLTITEGVPEVVFLVEHIYRFGHINGHLNSPASTTLNQFASNIANSIDSI